MTAHSKHLARAEPDQRLPTMVYFEDRDSLFDAPIEVVWDYIEKDEEFHPKAHRTSLRNIESRSLSEITSLVSCEVRWGAVGEG